MPSTCTKRKSNIRPCRHTVVFIFIIYLVTLGPSGHLDHPAERKSFYLTDHTDFQYFLRPNAHPFTQ
jgi:hypothetical protein